MSWNSALVITYGRSGSTLLMGVLNSIDGYLIRGENQNCFYGLYQFHKALAHAKQHAARPTGNTPTHPWFNQLSLSDVKRQLIELARTTICGAEQPRVYGFKEIRYFPAAQSVHGIKDYDTFADYLEFLSEIFPRVCFVFNTRKVEDTIRSGWWTQNPERSRQVIETAQDWFAQYARSRDNCFPIRYEDVVARGPGLQALFEFLGEKYDESIIEEALAVRYDY